MLTQIITAPLDRSIKDHDWNMAGCHFLIIQVRRVMFGGVFPQAVIFLPLSFTRWTFMLPGRDTELAGKMMVCSRTPHGIIWKSPMRLLIVTLLR